MATLAYESYMDYNDANYSCFQLISNIDLSEYYWAPIGINIMFQGCFWGDGYVISGMRFPNGDWSEYYRTDINFYDSINIQRVYGLFGYVGEPVYRDELMNDGRGQIDGVVVSVGDAAEYYFANDGNVMTASGLICAISENALLFRNTVIGNAVIYTQDSILVLNGVLFGLIKSETVVDQCFVRLRILEYGGPNILGFNGGLIGGSVGGARILNSYVFIEEFYNDTSHGGGIIASIWDGLFTEISKCYFVGNVNYAKNVFGGILGIANVGNCDMHLNFSLMPLLNQNNVGSLIGDNSSGINSFENYYFSYGEKPVGSGDIGSNYEYTDLGDVQNMSLPIFGEWDTPDEYAGDNPWVFGEGLGVINENLPVLSWSIVEVDINKQPSSVTCSATMEDLFFEGGTYSGLRSLIGLPVELRVVVTSTYKFRYWEAGNFYDSSLVINYYLNRNDTIINAVFQISDVTSYFCGNYISLDGGTTFTSNKSTTYGTSTLNYTTTSGTVKQINSSTMTVPTSFITKYDDLTKTTFNITVNSSYQFLGWYRGTSNNVNSATQVSTLTSFTINSKTTTTYYYFAKIQRKVVNITANLRASTNGATWPVSAGGGTPTIQYYNNKNVLTTTNLNNSTTTLSMQIDSKVTVTATGAKGDFMYAGISTAFKVPGEIVDVSKNITLSNGQNEFNVYFVKTSYNKLKFELEGENISTVSNVKVTNLGVDFQDGYGFDIYDGMLTDINNVNGVGRWYISQNQGQSNSFSMCRINFYAAQEGMFTISAVNRGELGCDFGMFGLLDTELYQDSSMDDPSNLQWSFDSWEFCEETSGDLIPEEVKTISYYVTEGEHFIDVKYIKDGSNDISIDSLMFKFGISIKAIMEGGGTFEYTEGLAYVPEDGCWFTSMQNNSMIALQFIIPDDIEYTQVVFEVINPTSSGTFYDLNSFTAKEEIYYVSNDKQYVVYDNVTPGEHAFIVMGNESFMFRPCAVYGEIWDVVDMLTPILYGRGFSQNSNGYYESQNKGLDNSYALAKFNFVADSDGLVHFDVISSGENNYDYGIFSKLDKTLSQSNSADSSSVVQKSFKGLSSTNVQRVTYNVTKGSHFIYIKYIKDASVNSGNDSLQFKINSTEPLTGGYFYFEDGEYPQSYVGTTLNNTLNSVNLSKSDELMFNDGTGNKTFSVYTYNGEKYAALTAPKTMTINLSTGTYSFTKGNLYFFKVEPIRWAVSDHGVSSQSYPKQWGNYGAYNSNFTVISDKILGFGAVSSTNLKEGKGFKDSEMYSNVSNSNEFLQLNYAAKDATSFYDKYGNFSQDDKVNQDIFSFSNIKAMDYITNSGRNFYANAGAVNVENVFSYCKVNYYDKSGKVTQILSANTVRDAAYTSQFTKNDSSSYLRIGFNGNKVDALFTYDISGLRNGNYVISLKLDSLEKTKGGYGSFSDIKFVRAGTDVVEVDENGIKVASLQEIDSLLSDRRAVASDMVAFMLGVNTDDYVDYWTRNLGSNLGNGKVVTKSGIDKSTWLNVVRGVRFSMTMSEGSRL